MWIWLSIPAFASSCPPVVELPAALASARAWDDRVALAACTEREPAQQERAEQVVELLKRLQVHQPKIERGPLRALVDAASSEDAIWVEQAMRAAQVGWPMPERAEDQDWFASVPVPVPAGTTLPLDPATDPVLAEAAGTVAADAGWTVASPTDGPSIRFVAKDPAPAQWGEHRGYALALTATAGDHTVDVEGFVVGPLAADTRRQLLVSAVAQALANGDLVATLAPSAEVGSSPEPQHLDRVPASELCMFRRADNAGVAVHLIVGPQHEISVPTASHGCLELPSGIEIRSPYGARSLAEGRTLVELSDRGEPTGRFRILDGDQELADKLLHKGKLDPWTPEVRPADP